MSTTGTKRAYATLLSRNLPAVIQNEAENERCIRQLEALDAKGRLNSAERRLAELLTLLIEDFEDRHYSLKKSSSADTLEELMLANGLRQKDLLDVFGTPSIASEVLSGRRNLTVEHIRKLSNRFSVSPEIFF